MLLAVRNREPALMRVAIAGMGNVGQFIAADLLDAGHQVALLEKDPAVVAAARPTLPLGDWYTVDACEVLSLEFAGVRHADVMVAATGDDEDNLVIALLAKQEFAVPRVVARVNNPKNRDLFSEAWGVDVAVSTPHILRSLVEEAVTVGSMVPLLQFEQGQVALHEVRLADPSPAIGRALRELDLPADAAIVAIVRAGRVIGVKDETVFRAGDEVLAIATKLTEDYLAAVLVGEGSETVLGPAGIADDPSGMPEDEGAVQDDGEGDPGGTV